MNKYYQLLPSSNGSENTDLRSKNTDLKALIGENLNKAKFATRLDWNKISLKTKNTNSGPIYF